MTFIAKITATVYTPPVVFAVVTGVLLKSRLCVIISFENIIT